MILLLALACRPDAPLGPPSPAIWATDASPVTLALVGGESDEGPVQAWVRARNGVSGSVFGGPRSVVVDGASRPVEINAEGYATVAVEGQGTHELSVTGDETLVYIYGAPFHRFGLAEGVWAPMAARGDAVAAGRGVLTVQGASVWWTGAAGRSHEVLRTEGNVGGVVAGNLDGDGVLDAVVWGRDTLHLLRGRAAGGMIYGGALRSGTHQVGAVAIGDASGDGLADLAITWVGGPSAGRLDVWEGDGLLAFASLQNRVLEQRPFGVAVGDNLGDDTPDVTVGRLDGNWWRFYRGPAYYAPMGPSLILELDPESSLLSPRDVNGDGADELLFVSAWEEGVERQIQLFDLAEEVVQIAGLDRAAGHVALTDLEADGREEILLHDAAGALSLVRGADGAEGLSTESLYATGTVGPVGVPPGSTRVLVAAEPAWLWLDTVRTAEGWSVRRPQFVSPGLTIPGGVFELRELDGDLDRTELVALRPNPTRTELHVVSVDETGAAQRGIVELSPEPKPIVDLAVCGTVAWVLVEGAAYRVSLADLDQLEVLAETPVTGRKIACGAGPAGPVAILQDTQVALFDASFAQTGVSAAAGAENLILGPLGTRVCTRVGCDLRTGPVGPGGAEALVEGWPTGAEIDGEPIRGAGLPTIADLDGNGFPDLLLHQDGRLVVYRHTGDTLGPGLVLHTAEAVTGRMQIADLDGDGRLDAWAVEPGGERLKVTPSGDVPTPPPPPGDTGLTDSDTAL